MRGSQGKKTRVGTLLGDGSLFVPFRPACLRPGDETRHCEVLRQVVAWETLVGKGARVSDGSTVR